MYSPDEYLCLEAELIVACDAAKAAIEDVDIAIAFLPPEESP